MSRATTCGCHGDGYCAASPTRLSMAKYSFSLSPGVQYCERERERGGGELEGVGKGRTLTYTLTYILAYLLQSSSTRQDLSDMTV